MAARELETREAFPFDELVDDLKKLLVVDFLDLPSLVFLGMTSKSNQLLAHKGLSDNGRVERRRLYKKLARYGSKESIDFVFGLRWKLGRRDHTLSELFLEALFMRSRLDIFRSFRIIPQNREKYLSTFQYGSDLSCTLHVLRVSFVIGASGSHALKEYLCGPEVNFPIRPLSYANGLACGGHLDTLIEALSLNETRALREVEMRGLCRVTLQANRFPIVEYLRSKFGVSFSRIEAEKLGGNSIIIPNPFSNAFDGPRWSKKLSERMLKALQYLDAAGAPLGEDHNALKTIIFEGDSLESVLFLEEKYHVLSKETNPILDHSDLTGSRFEESLEKSDRIECLTYLFEKFPTRVLSDPHYNFFWRPLVRRLFAERWYLSHRDLSLILQKYHHLFKLMAKYSKPSPKILEDIDFLAKIKEFSPKWFWDNADFVEILSFLQSQGAVIPDNLSALLPK